MTFLVQIVVNVPAVSGIYDYAVPESLAGIVGVGHLVIVPFGKQTAQGVVFRFIDQPSVKEVKEVSELVDPEPVLTQAQIALAETMADALGRDVLSRVIATLKHFAAHGQPESGQNCAPVNVSERVLLTTVIGSGIMAERLAGGNVALALLANTLATVGALFVLIELLAPISGAHFNPVVTAVLIALRRAPGRIFIPYLLAQLTGAMLGAFLAHAMFDLSLLQWSAKIRNGNGQLLGEVIASAGLVLVILRAPASKVSALVACYIGAAYWFTSSTSFANPAAAFGRMFSDTFAGIAPTSVPGFIGAEIAGGMLGVIIHLALGNSGNLKLGSHP